MKAILKSVSVFLVVSIESKASFALFFILGLVCNVTIAQQKINMESLVPPSPNAAEINKYGQIPVGLNTGIPDISFPLYEIKSGSLSLPITLSYHASGNQVNQRATDVGLGWSINAGGQINRSVNGIADDANSGAYGYFNYTPPDFNTINNLKHVDTLTKYIQDYSISNTTTAYTGSTFWGHDLEPDMFYYNIAGKSGRFIYTKAKSFMTIPFEPLKVEKYLDNANKVCFRITADNGEVYTFSKYTTTLSTSGAPSSCAKSVSYISTWQLSSIISGNTTDTISFEYETVNIYDEMEQHVKTFGLRGTISSSNSMELLQILDVEPDPCTGFGKVKPFSLSYNELRIKKIKFKNGYVLFNRNNITRSDVPSGELATNHALSNIEVYGLNNQLIKKHVFETDYYTAMPTSATQWKNYRLRLKRFYELDAATLNKNEYKFEYESTPLPYYGSYNIDYWGFSNGQLNSELLPYGYANGSLFINLYLPYLNGNTSKSVFNTMFDSGSNFPIGTANRDPSATYMASGILQKITYPTGGYTKFEFEPHKYNSLDINGQNRIGGGLRVKSIKKFSDANVLAEEEYFKYGENEDGIGFRTFNEDLFYKNYDDVVGYYPHSFYLQGGLNSTPDGDLTAWRRNFLGISKYNSPSFNGSPVIYKNVTTYRQMSGANGKTEYLYEVNPSFHELIPLTFVNSGNYGFINNAWHQGDLLEEIQYKYKNNQYIPVRKIKNEYISYNQREEVAILFKQSITPEIPSGFKLMSFDGYQILGPNDGSTQGFIVLTQPYGFFSIYPYSINTGAYRKSKETMTTYDPDNSLNNVVKVTDFSYENVSNRYLTKTVLTTSSNTPQINRFKYPQDMTDPVSLAMVVKNMLSPVIEEKTYQLKAGAEALLSTIRTNYKQFGNQILKDNVKASVKSDTLETRLKFNKYSLQGNLLEQQIPYGPKTTYLWGYGSQYPIAEIKNASYDEVLTVLGSSVIDNLNKTVHTEAIMETLIKNAAATLRSDARLSKAMVTNYTYKPLVGMTSKTDSRGVTEYYQYDGMQRLKAVLDQFKDVTKAIDYHYRPN